MKAIKWISLLGSFLFITSTLIAQSATSVADFWNSKQYLMDIDGRNNQRFLKQAGTAEQMLHFQQTQASLDNAVAENPNSVHTLMNRARFKKKFGMEQEAALDVRLALQRNPYAADLYGYDNPYRKIRVIAYEPQKSATALSISNRMSYYNDWLDNEYMSAKYDDNEYIKIESIIYDIEFENHIAAEDKVNNLIELYPTSAIAYDLKGLLMTKLERIDEATEALTKAVALAPDFAIAWYNLSRLEQAKGNLDIAKQHLDKAIDLQSDLTKAYFNRALLHKTMGDKEAAIQDYNQIISIRGEDYMEAFLNRGLTRKMLGDYTGALNDLNKVIENDPNNADLYKNRGNIYMIFGKYYDAINDYSKAIQLDENYAEAYYNRGLVGYLVHEHGGACVDLEQSFRLGYDRALEMLTYFCQE